MLIRSGHLERSHLIAPGRATVPVPQDRAGAELSVEAGIYRLLNMYVRLLTGHPCPLAQFERIELPHGY